MKTDPHQSGRKIARWGLGSAAAFCVLMTGVQVLHAAADTAADTTTSEEPAPPALPNDGPNNGSNNGPGGQAGNQQGMRRGQGQGPGRQAPGQPGNDDMGGPMGPPPGGPDGDRADGPPPPRDDMDADPGDGPDDNGPPDNGPGGRQGGPGGQKGMRGGPQGPGGQRGQGGRGGQRGPGGQGGPGGQDGQNGPSPQAMAAHDLNRAYRAIGMASEGDAVAPEAVKLIALSRSWYSAASASYTAKNYDKAHQLGLASAELADAAGDIGENAGPPAALKGLATPPSANEGAGNGRSQGRGDDRSAEHSAHELNRAYTTLGRVERGQIDGDVKNWVGFASSCYRTGLADYTAKNYDSALKHASVAGEVADAIDHYEMGQNADAAAKLPAPPEG